MANDIGMLAAWVRLISHLYSGVVKDTGMMVNNKLVMAMAALGWLIMAKVGIYMVSIQLRHGSWQSGDC